MRYKNPTPNPLRASEEGAMMYIPYVIRKRYTIFHVNDAIANV
ncbi:hypothetical protein [Nostoc sp. NMS7]|nr:hypothetical protein [Nostoc sp. NMS7]